MQDKAHWEVVAQTEGNRKLTVKYIAFERTDWIKPAHGGFWVSCEQGRKFYVFGNVHCDIQVSLGPTKCTLLH